MQYALQLGFVMCHKGYLDQTTVYDMAVTPVGILDARNCGMGTVLTSLCMIDPELDMLPTNEILEYFEADRKTATTIKQGCQKFVGLHMVADPKTGAYKNFNAALNNGYNKMLFKTNKGAYRWYDTTKAKECYNHETGMIGDDINFGIHWWFCEEIPGKFPKFPSLKKCGDKDTIIKRSTILP